jgi:hypothetical protein
MVVRDNQPSFGVPDEAGSCASRNFHDVAGEALPAKLTRGHKNHRRAGALKDLGGVGFVVSRKAQIVWRFLS